eukprot:scaffold965_cov93-Cylindrotheca_fusiformis.AAC.10
MQEDNPVASVVEFVTSSSNTTTENEHEQHQDGPFPLVEDVLQCQLSHWYPTFSNLAAAAVLKPATQQTRQKQQRSNVTIPTRIIQDLPEDFKDYLLSDGLRLPLDATQLSSYVAKEKGQDDDDEGWSSDDDNDDDEEDGEHDDNAAGSECSQQKQQQFHFPQLNEQIKNAIEYFGGSVIPKLNWSSPKDASWVHGGTIQCKTPGDVYLLLKSSDFCLHDVLLQTLKECADYNHTNTIRHCFANGTVANYVVDIYLDKKDRAWILDFNPWSKSTDSLLFEWSELQILDVEEDPHFRIVETDRQVRQDPLASYRAPIDTIDLMSSMTSTTGGSAVGQEDRRKFEEFMKQCQKPSAR